MLRYTTKGRQRVSTNTKEARERIEQVDMLALAGAIFAHLPGWTVEPLDPDVDDYAPPRMTYVRIKHASGARCSISRSTWPPECNVGGYWPRLGDQQTGEEYAPRERPGASFSPFRDPGALAKDINRRFLSVYLPEWETQRQKRDEAGVVADRAHRLAVELGAVLGENPREQGRGGWRIYARRAAYCLDVSRWGGVSVERMSFGADQHGRALEFARLITRWHDEDEAHEADRGATVSP
jgi:hypothetical protein